MAQNNMRDTAVAKERKIKEPLGRNRLAKNEHALDNDTKKKENLQVQEKE